MRPHDPAAASLRGRSPVLLVAGGVITRLALRTCPSPLLRSPLGGSIALPRDVGGNWPSLSGCRARRPSRLWVRSRRPLRAATPAHGACGPLGAHETTG